MCGNSASDWNTIAMSRSCVACAPTSSSPIQILPVVGFTRPAIIRSTVDLPEPDGPSSVSSSPRSISRSRDWTASISPNCLCTPSSRTAAEARAVASDGPSPESSEADVTPG